MDSLCHRGALQEVEIGNPEEKVPSEPEKGEYFLSGGRDSYGQVKYLQS